MFFICILIGLICGIPGGMGLGGGTLLIPAISYFLNIEQIMAQKINLICFLPMSIIALIFHSKHKMLDNVKDLLPVIFSGIIASVIGATIAKHTNNVNLKTLFSLFLIAIGLYQLYCAIFIVQNDKNK